MRAIRAPLPAPPHHPDPCHAKYASLLRVRELILGVKIYSEAQPLVENLVVRMQACPAARVVQGCAMSVLGDPEYWDLSQADCKSVQ